MSDSDIPSRPPSKKRKLFKSVNDHFQKMLKNDTMHDIEFLIGEEKKLFPGMRALFAAQSEPLEKMLYSEMKEGSKENPVVLEDIDVAAFQYFYDLCN